MLRLAFPIRRVSTTRKTLLHTCFQFSKSFNWDGSDPMKKSLDS